MKKFNSRGKSVNSVTLLLNLRFPFPNPLIKEKELRIREESEAKARKEIRERFKMVLKDIGEMVENVGLFYDKLVPIVSETVCKGKRNDKSLKGYECKKKVVNEILGDYKFEFLKAISEKEANSILEKLVKRVEEEKSALQMQGYLCLIAEDREAKSRLVVGLGSESVLETSLTFHKVWGIPYIPATALKGVMRMVYFWDLATRCGTNDSEKLAKLQKMNDAPLADFLKQEDEIRREFGNFEEIKKCKYLFGAPDFKGLLVFLDAYPLNLKFEVDIMNVHYPEYYSGKMDKAEDYEKPNPIFFLTVAPKTKFRIVLLFDKKRCIDNELFLSAEGLRDELLGKLRIALREFGIGAKTRVGYGILG